MNCDLCGRDTDEPSSVSVAVDSKEYKVCDYCMWVFPDWGD